MSHDRGCWKCGEDPSAYATCASAVCPKRKLFCSGCQGHTIHHTCGQLPDADAPPPVERAIKQAREHLVSVLPTSRPICNACGREQPLWGNCFRPASECPVRAAFEPNRPTTRIISVNEPGYEVVLFFNEDGGAQAVVSRPGGKDPIDVLIAPPIPGRRIVVERKGNVLAVSYKDVQS